MLLPRCHSLRKASKDAQSGFSLVELLVVIMIVAVLAAISIPIFVSHREKAARAQVVSALKNASTFMHVAESENGFADVTVGELLDHGLRYSESVELFLASDPQSFCFLARHEDHDIALYLESDSGTISESGSPECPTALPESPGGEVPGDEVPGDEVPGDEVPGDEVPGDEVPGDEVPGDEVPGDEVPGDGGSGGSKGCLRGNKKKC